MDRSESPSMQQTSLMRSWVIQWRVISALLMREILTRYGRHNIGFFWLFLEPMMFTLGVTALWTAMQLNHGSNLPIVAFALTGYSCVLLWRNMPARSIGAVAPNLSLMYHRNVKVIDVFAARLLLEAAGATISFVVLGCFFIGIGWMQPPEDVLMIAMGWVLTAWFGASLALLLGAWAEKSELVEKIWHPLAYLLFPLSGAAFIVDALPTKVQQYVLLLPMVNGVEMVREGYFGSGFKAHYSIVYMVCVCLGLSLLALAQVRETGRKVMPE
jgi:ABC-type polysaccharide/polyol phosphate export permease